jgi:hypothetical protein
MLWCSDALRVSQTLRARSLLGGADLPSSDYVKELLLGEVIYSLFEHVGARLQATASEARRTGGGARASGAAAPAGAQGGASEQASGAAGWPACWAAYAGDGGWELSVAGRAEADAYKVRRVPRPHLLLPLHAAS